MAEAKVIEVVGGIIRRGDMYLLGKRPLGKSQGGKWEFIGGKIEPGETPEQALARECMEEIALPIVNAKIRTSVTHAYPDRTIHLTLIDCEPAPDAEPKSLEHPALGWFTAVDALKLNFCPADIELLPTVFQNKRSPMTNEKNMFVSVRQVWDTGETSDILALEVEAKSNFGRLIQNELAERMEAEVGREWPRHLICDIPNDLDDYGDSIKVIDQFVLTKPDWNLRIVIGRADSSLLMPKGETCLKVSSTYLWGLGRNRL